MCVTDRRAPVAVLEIRIAASVSETVPIDRVLLLDDVGQTIVGDDLAPGTGSLRTGLFVRAFDV